MKKLIFSICLISMMILFSGYIQPADQELTCNVTEEVCGKQRIDWSDGSYTVLIIYGEGIIRVD